jgi:ABC-2 type transport system ATP-binding protein
MNPVIYVEDLHKNYGSLRAVDGVSFEVAKGEIFCLLGPNGAGKTTVVECLEGLKHPDSGVASVLGLNPVTQSVRLRKRIGCQLQQSALPDRIRVWEALKLFASILNTGKDWRVLLEEWGLEDKANSTFASLSGGQRQRLLVALALVNDPEVVFLDEMTTGLDPAARHVAWNLIRTVKEQGKTIILVTHFMDEAQELGDRLAIMNHGRVVATDTPQGLINRYSHEKRVLFTASCQDFSWLKELPEVRSVDQEGARITVTGEGALLARVAAAIVGRGIVPDDLRLEQPSLEDVYLRLTGHSEDSA